MAERRYCGHGFLMPGHQLVPRPNLVGAQRTPPSHIREHHFERGLLIFQHSPESLIGDPFDRMRRTRALEPLGDELLGDSSPQRVEVFDLPVFDREGPLSFEQPPVHERP